MARISFSSDVSAPRGVVNFPKLKLEKDESARIVLLEDPVMAYVHSLEKPQILNGAPVFETKERFKDKSTYQVHKTDFVSAFLCLGDEDIMAERGVDPDNCPACKASTRSDQVKAPRRRYAVNVLRYATKPGTSDPTPSFNASVEAWVFSDQQFSRLRKLVTEGWVLRDHDLSLGPCSDPSFQKFDIVPSQVAVWQQSESNKERALEIFNEGKASVEDLEGLCARRTEKKWIEADLDVVADRWAELNGTPSSSANLPAGSLTLPKESTTVPSSPATKPESSSLDGVTLNFDDLLDLNKGS